MEKELKDALNSIVNQTMDLNDIEVIMVNDCSTDGSDKIIDEYAEKYDCCVAIHHETNSGGAHTPRNTGIEASTGDYIMFLDPDDRYVPDACERLYNAVKKYDVDLAFARFKRIFEYGGYIQESYSPYEADLKSAYPDETFETANFLDVPDFLWDNVIERVLYGKTLEVTYPRDGPIDTIHVDNIEQEPDLLKIQPSVWCKIYRRELIMDKNLRFQKYVTGDDMAFTLEALLNAEGIVYLNNYFSYDYYIRDLPNDKSITNNVNVRLLDELMEAYIYCRKKTEGFSKEVQTVSLNPHLLHWMHTWKTSPFTKEENRLLLKKVNKLKKIHDGDFKTRMLMSSMTTAIETAIHTAKE
jgi:glycosyltransferase involved in cell wall biosynthesis